MPRLAPIILIALAASPGRARAADDFAFYHENVMGTSLELRVRADAAEAARRAEALVLAEIDRLAAIFSGYDPASEFRRWQAAPKGPVQVSPELFEVLVACDRWRTLSGGAFDPRVEVLSQLWSRCARQGRTPSPDELAGARALLAPPAWRLDPEARTAERLTDCPLSLNAIAKGYIVGRASEVALKDSRGVVGLLLNVGGDLRVVGDDARTIAVAPPGAGSESSEPLSTVAVRGRAVATSGSTHRGFRIGGDWYSHIIDPRSGLPAGGVAGATVIAGPSADADALATVLNVLAPEDGLRLAASLPDVECLIVAADGRVVRSPGWGRYETKRPTPIAFADAPAGAWGDEFELVVNFEIARPEAEAGRYRRPYVAVWIEDKDGFPVRTLALWVSLGGPGPFQWLPDLKRWYRADKVRRQVDKTDMIQTISQPTRRPGQYTLLWDGKDGRGRPLPPGEYTVFIDAAREHGTYQGIRQQVTVAGTPFAEELKGNVEIQSASIAYRRKAPAR